MNGSNYKLFLLISLDNSIFVFLFFHRNTIIIFVKNTIDSQTIQFDDNDFIFPQVKQILKPFPLFIYSSHPPDELSLLHPSPSLLVAWMYALFHAHLFLQILYFSFF